LKKNDIAIDTTQEQQAIDFHGIPAQDVMIAMYASYFSGVGQDGRFDLDSRAINTFGMNDALTENFTGDNAPWVMLDSLSDGRNNSNTDNNMAGAHFVTMYHKDTQQVVITMPGMEYDYGPSDTLDDAKQLITGSNGQTQALQGYVEYTSDKIKNAAFKDADGKTIQLSSDKPIIASHSLGSKPTHVMSVAGYDTIMMEPRPLTGAYIDSLAELYQDTYGGDIKTAEDIIGSLDLNTVSVRAGHANIWNSPLMPWTSSHNVPNTYIYGTGEGATLSGRHVTDDHAAEVLVPSTMRHWMQIHQHPKPQKVRLVCDFKERHDLPFLNYSNINKNHPRLNPRGFFYKNTLHVYYLSIKLI
jgi:hypothetical protein